jgi:predicted DNA-binding protein
MARLTETFLLRLSLRHIERLAAVALKFGKSMSSILRQCIDDLYEKEIEHK